MAKKKIDLGASKLFQVSVEESTPQEAKTFIIQREENSPQEIKTFAVSEKDSDIQIVPNEESPLYEDALRDIEIEKNDPRIKRKGRPKNEELIRGVSSQFGLTKDFRRASYIMPIELIEFVENYAYTERIRIQDAISKLVTIGKNQVEKEYRKEGKELLRKDKKK